MRGWDGLRCASAAPKLCVLLTPKSGLYSLKVGMSAIGTKSPFEFAVLFIQWAEPYMYCIKNYGKIDFPEPKFLQLFSNLYFFWKSSDCLMD
jgi:hypothetical protein